MTTPSDTAHPEGERELLPCPFCGSAAKLFRSEKPGGYGWHLHWVSCTNEDGGCVATSNDGRFPKKVVEVWNTRSTPPSRPQGEEGLRPDFSVTTTIKRVWEAGHDWARFGRESASGSYDDVVPKAVCEILSALSNQGKPSS